MVNYKFYNEGTLVLDFDALGQLSDSELCKVLDELEMMYGESVLQESLVFRPANMYDVI